VLAGLVVLAYPGPSGTTLGWLFSLGLIAIGLMAIVGEIVTSRGGSPRRRGRRSPR
jgi:hypothetical protein